MPKQSAEDRVVEVLEAVGQPLATGEIADELSEQYKSSTIRGAISSLRKQGRVVKVKQGVYRLPKDNERTNGQSRRESSNKSEQGDPIYRTPAEAGDGTMVFDEEPVGHMPAAQSLSSAGREVYWMPVIGDSMGEKYKRHTLVPVAKFTDPVHDFAADDVYVIRWEGAIKIKRLQRIGGRRVRIISDNEAYPNEIIELDDGVDFEILGRVLV